MIIIFNKAFKTLSKTYFIFIISQTDNYLLRFKTVSFFMFKMLEFQCVCQNRHRVLFFSLIWLLKSLPQIWNTAETIVVPSFFRSLVRILSVKCIFPLDSIQVMITFESVMSPLSLSSNEAQPSFFTCVSMIISILV